MRFDDLIKPPLGVEADQLPRQLRNYRLRGNISQRNRKAALITKTQKVLEVLHFTHKFKYVTPKQLLTELWPTVKPANPRKIIKQMFDNGLLARHSKRRHLKHLSVLFYWVGTLGNDVLADQMGADFKPHRHPPLKNLAYNQPRHALTLVDIYQAFMRGLDTPEMAGWDLSSHGWITDLEFKGGKQRTSYINHAGQQAKRAVEPDGWFAVYKTLEDNRKLVRAFALELDLSTHQVKYKLENQKLRAGAAWIDGPGYVEHIGVKTGCRWLFVCHARERMANIMGYALQAGVEGVFRFTTTEYLFNAPNPLTTPIWYRPGNPEPLPLFQTET